MRDKVLKILLDNLTKSISGEAISQELGISRAAVWKHINKLKEMGADINSTTGGGYCLRSVPDWLNPEVFKYYNESINVHIVNDTPSTNSLAISLSDNGLESNSMVISSTQSNGKGRLSRAWNSLDGGVWMSILMRPNLSPNAIPPVTLLTAVAVTRALEDIFDDIHLCIKWPNDIYLNNKKIGGILVEATTDIDGVRHVIIGIGVNANNSVKNMPDEIKNTADTLSDNGFIAPRALIAAAIHRNVIDIITQYESENDISFVMDYYSNHMLWHGRQVMLRNMGLNKVEDSGTLIGIGNMGELIIECDGKQKKIVSGELSLRQATLD